AQRAELWATGRILLGAVPPVPVATLGDEQFLISQLALLLMNIGRLIVGLARAQQILPGFVVLLGADPDVEIGADPGSGKDAIERLGSDERQRLADGDRLHVRFERNPPVQLAQKGAAIAV